MVMQQAVSKMHAYIEENREMYKQLFYQLL